MKNIKFSCRQILRTIRAACIALFIAASAGQANAAPHFTSDFSLSGSTVTVAGSPNNTTSAYFVDLSPNAYAFTISSAANIGNTTDAGAGFGTNGNLITFDNGSVNNAGTLNAVHYAIFIGSSSSAVTSSMTNSGSITSTGYTAVDFRGNGTVNNLSGGTISGYNNGIYFSGGGGASSVTNAGLITATSTSTYAAGVGFGQPSSSIGASSFSLVNYGMISGSSTYGGNTTVYGVTASTYGGNINISNGGGGVISGTATASGGYYSATASGISASSNYGNITVTNNGMATGMATATDDGFATGYGILTSSISGATTIVNNGTATGTGSGYYAGTGSGIFATSTAGNVTIINNGTATGMGTASAGYSNVVGVVINPLIHVDGPTAEGYGIFAYSEYGSVTVTNNGTATGTGTASGGYVDGGDVIPLISSSGPVAVGYGIFASSTFESVTVTNNGMATGTGSGYYSGTGYGISTASTDRLITIVNNGTATGTGSGYYLGTGYGVSATSDSGYISITNNNTATGMGTASGYFDTPKGTGYGIYASTDSGYIQIFNNCAATGTGTATASSYDVPSSASGYGYGIYAHSTSGNILIQNCGQATGTGSGYYSATGAGIYAASNNEGPEGNIFIVNDGLASGSASAYGTLSEPVIPGPAVVTPQFAVPGGAVLGYGIYAQSDSAITIDNLCNAFGTATAGSFENIEDPLEFGVPSATAIAVGINVVSSGSGPILINNSGTASGYAGSFGTGFAYGIGINVASTGSASVTINNSGVVAGVGFSFGTTGSGYGIFIGNSGAGPIGSGPVTITNQVSGVISGSGYTEVSSASSYGIFLASGTGPATITNKGTISAFYGISICAPNYAGPITVNEIGGAVTTGAFSSTGSGAYIGGPPSILLGSGVNTVNIVGQSNNTSFIDGGTGGANTNTLTMQLAGMTPAQKANLIAAVAATQNGSASGPIFAGGVTYSWVNFENVSGSFVSLEQAVDPGLMNIATKIDNLPTYLGVAFGPFYVAAASNPEAALNSLVGREFDDAVGVISKNDATALSEVFDSRAFDLRTGTGGFDLSGLNILSGSMIASLGDTENTLGRLMGTSAMGGTRMSDSKEVITPVANTNRWGAWASGTVTLADESSSASGQSFNYTTGSPTIGADYRICNHFALGALLNFSTTGANFDDGSRLGVQTGVAALYGTFSDGPWYANALVGGGISSYDNHRVTLTGDTASSSPDGDEILANLTGGYDFKLGGGWTVSPEGGFLYTHVTENGYTESGASAFDLTLPDQNIDSLRSKLGFRVTDNFTWDKIAFTPQIRASWYHEILDDSRGVTTSLGGAPALGSFVVQTNTEGRDFADLGAGLSATPAELSGDVTFFVNYDAQVGQDNFIAHTVNGGLRVNF